MYKAILPITASAEHRGEEFSFPGGDLNGVPIRARSTVFVLTGQFSGLQAFIDLHVFSGEANASLTLWCFRQKKNSQPAWCHRLRRSGMSVWH